MADNVTVKDASDTATPIATDDVGGVQFQKVKLDLGGDGVSVPVSGSVPVSDAGGSLTVDGTVGVSGTVTVTGPLTDAQLRASRVPVQSSVPVGSAGVILNATTAAGGTTFVTFASQACTSLDVQNITGVTIEVQRGAAGNTFRIPSPGARIFYGITNANQIGVRRLDQSTAQVTVDAEALS